MTLHLMSNADANVSVDVPALGFSQRLLIQRGVESTVLLPSGNGAKATVVIDTPVVVYHFRAVHVTSDVPITIIGMNHKPLSSATHLFCKWNASPSHSRGWGSADVTV